MSKIKKASKDQEEILKCALQNDCSKIRKALGESLFWIPVLDPVLENSLEKTSDEVL